MTEPQRQAFKRSAGIEPATLLNVVVVISAGLILLWLAWLTYSQYQSWQKGQGDFYDALFVIISGVVVILIVGTFIK